MGDTVSAQLMVCNFRDQHDWENIWTAKVENKCRFFCWLLLQNRLWTSDRVLAHGGQGDGVCKLCYTHQKTALYMLARCPYSNADWQGLQGWLGITLQRPPRNSYRKPQG
jgi:hypothetical protein